MRVDLLSFPSAYSFVTMSSFSEELGILLSKNKESVMKIMKGAEIDGILEVESADVVELPAAKKKK